MAAGTKIADVWINIQGDLSEYNKSLNQAKTGATSIGQEIKNALSGGAVGRSGFGGFIEDLKLGGSLTTALRNNFTGMARDVGSLSLTGLRAGLQDVERVGSSVFGHLRSLASNVFRGFTTGLGIGAFFSIEAVISRLVEAIPNLIERGQKFAESVHTITIETGASAEKASTLLAIYQFLGGSSTDLNQKINRLATTIVRQGAAFNALGVATKDANGNTLDQITILDNLRRVFSTLPDGPEKTKLALLSFGRNGATALGPLLHYLGLTDDEINKLAEDAKNQGLVISESQILAADAVGKAQARIQNAITGLASTLFGDVGPKLASFFDGIADYITRNAQRISDAISAVVAKIIGLVQGILGIDLGSFSAQFSKAAEGGSQWAGKLVDDQKALDGLNKQLKPTTSSVQDHNAAIAASTKALDAETASIDKQITKIKDLGAVQDTVFQRQITNLGRAYDAELLLLSAEDQRIARQEQAAADQRSAEQADRNLAKSKRDLASAQVDLASAQAQYNKDLANPNSDAAAQRDAVAKDLIAIADAAQKVRDAQQGVVDAQQSIADVQQQSADHTRANAEADRRAEIAAVQAYVKSIETIVEQSENKKAALLTLKRRDAKLADELAAAQKAGDVQKAKDLETEIAAVKIGENQLANVIKNQSDTDALTKRKDQIAQEKTALQALKETQGAASRQAILDKIHETEAAIAEDKRQLAAETQSARDKKHLDDVNAESLVATYQKGGPVDSAFEEARKAGIAMATDIKNAIGGLIDLLLGPAGGGSPSQGAGLGATGPSGNRSGGLIGALSELVGTFGQIATGVTDIIAGISQFKPQDVGLGIAAAGVYFKSPQMILAGLALYAGGSLVQGVTDANSLRAGKGTEYTNSLPPAERAKAVAQANIALLSREDPRQPYTIGDKPTGETKGQALARLTKELAAAVFSNGGYEQGGLVPHPTFAALGERGQEFVLSNRALGFLNSLNAGSLPGLFSGAGDGSEFHIHVHVPWSNDAIDFISRGLAYRRRTS